MIESWVEKGAIGYGGFVVEAGDRVLAGTVGDSRSIFRDLLLHRASFSIVEEL